MPLLRAVVLETLRLHPTAFGISRTAAAAFRFAGRRVPRGQDVLAFTTAWGAIVHACELELAEPERAYPVTLMPTPSLGPGFALRFGGWRTPRPPHGP